jgi:hypothetical protein
MAVVMKATAQKRFETVPAALTHTAAAMRQITKTSLRARSVSPVIRDNRSHSKPLLTSPTVPNIQGIVFRNPMSRIFKWCAMVR